MVTSSTRGTRVRSSSAAVSPAMPEPTTIASTSIVQPAGGAASRVASRGGVSPDVACTGSDEAARTPVVATPAVVGAVVVTAWRRA
ncbi:MAG: hypothetical protein NVV70_15665 [Cellulomonas sp.]|nr:hypothetical protein [Cellulomonas sp.]MCR6649495.1 hypothetical protein [Cellulomonas sp.]